MKQRVVKKKIRQNVLCRMWLKAFTESAMGYNSNFDLCSEYQRNGKDTELIETTLRCLVGIMEFDLRSAYNVLNKHNQISRIEFLKCLGRYKISNLMS